MGTGSFGGGLPGGGSTYHKIGTLIDVTDAVNNAAESIARTAVSEVLRRSDRRKTLVSFLGSGFVNDVYCEIFELREAVVGAGGFEWAPIAKRYGVPEQRASLWRLRAAIVKRHSSAGVDENFVGIVNHAVADLFLRTVGEDDGLYADAAPGELNKKFKIGPLNRTANDFLTTVLLEMVRTGVLSLSTDAKATLRTVTSEIADRWVDVFKERFKDKRMREMLSTIAEHIDDFPLENP
jgi:hypothetical protein